MTVIIDTPILMSDYNGYPRPGTEIMQRSNEDFLGAALAVLGMPPRLRSSSRKLHVVDLRERYQNCNGAAYPVPTVSLGIQAVHQAFAAHVPLSLWPETLWYFIVHEAAEYARENPVECDKKLFTSTPKWPQTIQVPDNSLHCNEPSDWQRSIDLWREHLAAKVTDLARELFLPRFTTSAPEDEIALLIALMDVASPHVSCDTMYEDVNWGTECGIPQIRLEGDPSDWRDLCSRTKALAREFRGLSGYFANLLPVLQTIAETSNGTTPDEDFWRSIYKFGDSGRPFVTGWITAFFAYCQTEYGSMLKVQPDWQQDSYLAREFPSHVSAVSVKGDSGARYGIAAGITGVDYDTFLSPRLGLAVFER